MNPLELYQGGIWQSDSNLGSGSCWNATSVIIVSSRTVLAQAALTSDCDRKWSSTALLWCSTARSIRTPALSCHCPPRKICTRLGGWHVHLPADLIQDLPYFKQQERWAKADLVAQVSRERLFKPRALNRGYVDQVLDRELIERIQRATVKVMNAGSLLKD